jgi:colicin import membrane protein
MKKTYIYFLVPLLGVIAFAGVYWNFASEFEAKEAAAKAAERQRKEEKLAQEAKDREQAIKEALAAQERRKAERAAKEAKEKADQEARQLALEARDKASREKQKLTVQVERLQKDIKTEKDAIADIQEERKHAIDEQNFLKNYVQQAQANTKSLAEVLDKIAAADAARAAAEAAAAKAKNS